MGGVNTANYIASGLTLPADPNAFILQEAAVVAALRSAGAPAASLAGFSTVTTNSTTSYSTFVDTPVTARVDQYQTSISTVLIAINRSISRPSTCLSATPRAVTTKTFLTTSSYVISGSGPATVPASSPWSLAAIALLTALAAFLLWNSRHSARS